MKKYLGCILLLTLALFLIGACERLPDSFKVGIILPATGEKAKFGEIEKKSFEMALEEINAAGGINGKKLEFLYEDDTGRPDVARSAAEKLITKDKVVMLGGGYGSSETFAIAGRCSAEPDSISGQHRFGQQDHRNEVGLCVPPQPSRSATIPRPSSLF